MQPKKIDVSVALSFWVRDYGAGRVQWLGFSKTNILHPKHGLGLSRAGGRDLSVADNVQQIYMAMLATEFYRHAKVLEMECFHGDWPWEDKKKYLRLAGIRIHNKKDYSLWFLTAVRHVKRCLQDGMLTHEYGFTKVKKNVAFCV